MTLDDIKHLIELIREHDLSEFELEQEGFRLRIRKGGETVTVQAAPVAAPVVQAPAAPAPTAAAPLAPTDDEGGDLAIVKSPIVGTFYRAAEPGAPAFVDVGSPVRKGDVLCIIEAMKLMNEIDSEHDGEIASVYVENGQSVQYGERLFAIRLKR
ncbi:MAG: acetyl-CoA carboxylase biotin carboxyl carrier protein [Vicinamibacterales bacterium]|nr:acetyl-CoA carboxylase biotin carboxyl carrier protein [Vicinamibacterales bacterium]